MPSPLALPMSWDLVADAYAAEMMPAFDHFAREALRLAEVPAGGRVVDVACGPGTLSLVAAAAGHEVDALDFSPKMVEHLAAKKHPRVHARIGDGQALPYADGAFDAGFSLVGLIFFPDRAKGIAELRRVLRPGARAVISSWPESKVAPPLAAIFAAIGQVTGNTGPGEPPPLATEAAIRAELGASFGDVAVHTVTAVQRFASLDEMWSSFTRTFAPLVLLRPRLGDRWTELEEIARGKIAAALGGGPAEIVMPGLFSVATA